MTTPWYNLTKHPTPISGYEYPNTTADTEATIIHTLPQPVKGAKPAKPYLDKNSNAYGRCEWCKSEKRHLFYYEISPTTLPLLVCSSCHWRDLPQID